MERSLPSSPSTLIGVSGMDCTTDLPISWCHPYEADQGLDLSGLVLLAEELLGQTYGVGQRICATVETLTQQRAALTLDTARISPSASHPYNYHVQFAQRTYGYLTITAHHHHAALPALPLLWIQRLARATGAVLHLLEQEAFLAGLTHRLPTTPLDPLTAREQCVLTHMGKGLAVETIGQLMGVATSTVKKHQEHLRDKFSVTSSFDVLLIAFRSGMLRYVTT